jgi:hypothetical protein
MPNRWQRCFQGTPSARAHINSTSSRSRYWFQVIVSSMRLIADGVGGGRRIGVGYAPASSLRLRRISGQVLK